MTDSRFLYISMFLVFWLVGCEQPAPRKPIQHKSGSFLKESIERSKRVLAQEEKSIQTIIDNGPQKDFKQSEHGFWYRYEQEDSTAYRPQKHDQVKLTYTVMDLTGDTIYNSAAIGQIWHAVDKSKLFPGLREGVKLVGVGEKASFLFPSSLAYGYKGDNEKIGPNQPIKTSLSVLEILKDSINIKIEE